MLSKEAQTKKSLEVECLRLTDKYINELTLDDFNSMSQFGMEARNLLDIQSAIYFYELGQFILTPNAVAIIKSYLISGLESPILEDILDISETEDDYEEQTNISLNSAFARSKNKLNSDMEHTLMVKYQKAINLSLEALREKGILNNTNPYKNDSARIRKELYYDEAMNSGFDFSKVSRSLTDEDSVLKGFITYVRRRIPEIMEVKSVEKTPDELVIAAINNYYNKLTNFNKLRIRKIIDKNNNELKVKMAQSKFLLANSNGSILKYTSPVNTEYTFYQTAFGLWSISVVAGSEPVIMSVYTLTTKSLSDAVTISKKVANTFQLGISPIWVANKMYLNK